MIYRQSVGSTMDVARRELDEGAPSGTIVLAEEQTAGRGRQGRSFHSPAGENLYFTLLLRLATESAACLPLVVPTAIADACCESTGLDARIKWPNDIWIGGLKTCGMLIDAVSGPEGVAALIGIGVNVNGDPTEVPELRGIATSLRRESGSMVDRERLLAGICNGIETWLHTPALALATRYRQLSLVLGRPVTVTAFGRIIEGDVAAVEDDGSLVLSLADGSRERFAAGEVSLRPRV
jgi:BirA family biotin operon repressor/biotin-[acetyl-CoA-carboxylase] ligase